MTFPVIYTFSGVTGFKQAFDNTEQPSFTAYLVLFSALRFPHEAFGVFPCALLIGKWWYQNRLSKPNPPGTDSWERGWRPHLRESKSVGRPSMGMFPHEVRPETGMSYFTFFTNISHAHRTWRLLISSLHFLQRSLTYWHGEPVRWQLGQLVTKSGSTVYVFAVETAWSPLGMKFPTAVRLNSSPFSPREAVAIPRKMVSFQCNAFLPCSVDV